MTDPFACRIDEYALERACAPEQPAEVAPGQKWMALADGEVHPVKEVREGGRVCLGFDHLTLDLSEKLLRERFVCVDLPELPDVGRIY